ncbi:alkaline phosphatase family protein [Actinomycetospora aeridis]|uniref:Nucleotide pyrophosphatase/phosphodiesterase family protein n=1 Tax=Actinomycetospora aeridis TaxID=3129231 RepID=A0ABU8N0I0_9PSEU
MEDLVLPDATRPGLHDVMPALLDAVTDGTGRLGLPPVRAAALLLVDGLGHRLLHAHARDAPFLAAMAEHGPLLAGFPSSTSISVTSLGTGLPPGTHGTLGIRFRVDGTLLDSLTWTSDAGDARHTVELLVPEDVQPHPTVFERAVARDVGATVVSDRAFRESGLTRSALRGAQYRGVGAFGDLAAELLDALGRPGPQLVYGYHADLDQLGHLHGPGSTAWRWQLRQIDRLVEQLVAELPAGTLLAVTGDHGMVTVERRYDADTDDDLRAGVALVGGDPRARLVYAQDGAADDVLATWRGVLGEDAWVLPGAEVVERGWFGPLDEAVRPRIPDVVAVLRGGAAVVRSEGERLLARLPGQHGSLTGEEHVVPLLAAASV